MSELILLTEADVESLEWDGRITYGVDCDGCGDSARLRSVENPGHAASQCNHRGWRKRDGDILCPTCVQSLRD